MKHDSSTKSWSGLGKEWYKLAQSGESRIHFIMPYMLGLIGEVKGKKILDLGCGEGGYSRDFCKNGGMVTSIDCSNPIISYCKEAAEEEKLSIEHYIRNGNDLYGIEDDTYDIVLCSMMLMDVEDLDGTLKEVNRVLKQGGQLFVSILHPCFDGNHEHGIGRQGKGLEREVVVKDYFLPEQWEAPLPNGEIPVIWRHRTLSTYIKTFLKNGLMLHNIEEPQPSEEQAKISTSIAWLQKIPLFLFMELRKQ